MTPTRSSQDMYGLIKSYNTYTGLMNLSQGQGYLSWSLCHLKKRQPWSKSNNSNQVFFFSHIKTRTVPVHSIQLISVFPFHSNKSSRGSDVWWISHSADGRMSLNAARILETPSADLVKWPNWKCTDSDREPSVIHTHFFILQKFSS